MATPRTVPEDARPSVYLAQPKVFILFSFISVTPHKDVSGGRTPPDVLLSSIPMLPSALLAFLSGSGNLGRALVTKRDS